MKPGFRHIKTASIRGRTYLLDWRGHSTFRGRCDPPGAPFKRINVSIDKDPINTISTLLHECEHAAFFDLGEEAVEEFEHDFIRLLRRLPIKISYDE